MESSSSSVEQHESPDVLLQPFVSFKLKAARTECFVEERAGRNFWKKSGNGDAQVYELVMTKPRLITLVPYNLLSTKIDLPQDMSDSEKLGNGEVEQGSVQMRVWKQMANTSPCPAEEATGIHSKCKFLETGKENRRLSLNMHLETEAKCRHIQE